MLLPLKLPLDLMQTRWKAILDPWLKNPLSRTVILTNVKLANGQTIINHNLGQLQQGWFLVDKQGPAEIYRSGPFNALALTLTSSAAVTVSIGVF